MVCRSSQRKTQTQKRVHLSSRKVDSRLSAASSYKLCREKLGVFCKVEKLNYERGPDFRGFARPRCFPELFEGEEKSDKMKTRGAREPPQPSKLAGAEVSAGGASIRAAGRGSPRPWVTGGCGGGGSETVTGGFGAPPPPPSGWCPEVAMMGEGASRQVHSSS